MPTYQRTLTIDDHCSEQQLLQAVKLLNGCEGAVILAGIAILRPGSDEIICAVVDPTPGAHRCAEEFKVLIENAQRALAGSELGDLLPRKSLRWLIADGSGATLWSGT